MSASDIRSAYANYADWMHRFEWADRPVTGRYRGDRFGDVDGRVLDVACGTGTNFRYLAATVDLVGIDVSPEMLTNAGDQLAQLELEGTLRLVDHGSTDVRPIAQRQKWRADAHHAKRGCRWEQEPRDIVAEAGLSVRDTSTGPFGLITTFEIDPT